MAAGLEKLVRPYQLPERTIPFREIPNNLSQTTGYVVLRYGRAGRTKTFQGSVSEQATVYVVKRPKEKR